MQTKRDTGQWRLIVGYLMGACVLVIVFVVGLQQAGLLVLPAIYRPETTPEGVAYNYQLAIIKGDYERAYRYLSPSLINYPDTAKEFVLDLQSEQWDLNAGNRCVYVESIAREGTKARVKLLEQWYVKCGSARLPIAENLAFNYITVVLEGEGEQWQIVYADRYFAQCWTGDTLCK